MNNKNSVKTVVAVAIGAALFFALGRFVAIPSVEEHILCHKGAYTGKSGITRDRTGKPWYYRNLKR